MPCKNWRNGQVRSLRSGTDKCVPYCIIIHFPLSIIHYPLSIIHYPFSIIHYPLSIIHYPFSIFHYPLSIPITVLYPIDSLSGILYIFHYDMGSNYSFLLPDLRKLLLALFSRLRLDIHEHRC